MENITEYIDKKLAEYFKKYDWGLPADIDPHNCTESVGELERCSFREQFDMTEFLDGCDALRDLIKERLQYGNY
jgi:hypothetical protein